MQSKARQKKEKIMQLAIGIAVSAVFSYGFLWLAEKAKKGV